MELTLNISGWIIVSSDVFEEPVIKGSATEAADYIIEAFNIENTQLDDDLYEEALQCDHNGHSFGLEYKGKTYNVYYYSKVVTNF
jgi:hypothetical protein